jgi:hypothetical protein
MGHGLEDGIVELDGSWDQEGVVRGLRRHVGRWFGERGRGNGAINGFIFDVVRYKRVSLGREGGIEVRQRKALVQVSGDQAQTLRSRFGSQLSDCGEPRGKFEWDWILEVPEGNFACDFRGLPPMSGGYG